MSATPPAGREACRQVGTPSSGPGPAGGGKEGGTAVSEMPKVGEPAPDIRLQGIGGKEWHLAAQRGRTVVLLFYVLDWTPG